MKKAKPKRKRRPIYGVPEIQLGLEKAKSNLPAQLPYINTIDLVATEFGGRAEFVRACRVSTAPSVLNFVRIAEECPDIDLADVCVRAELAPDKLLEYVVPALYRWNGPVGRLINAINLPRSVKAGVESAQILGPDGFQDRKAQYQMGGLLAKDGPSTLVNNVINMGDLESFEDTVVDITPQRQTPPPELENV